MNLVLAAALVVPLRQGGLGLANTATSICNVGLLLFCAAEKTGQTGNGIAARNPFAAGRGRDSGGIGCVVRLAILGGQIGHGTLVLKIGAVFVPAGIAGLVYWLTALAFKIPAAKEMAEFALVKFKTVGMALRRL